MHDSRGAVLQVGDRVLIEAEITRLNTGGDDNYCCVDVQIVTPDQTDFEKAMQPPSLGALSTKMLTKVGKSALPPEAPVTQGMLDAAAKQPGGA